MIIHAQKRPLVAMSAITLAMAATTLARRPAPTPAVGLALCVPVAPHPGSC